MIEAFENIVRGIVQPGWLVWRAYLAGLSGGKTLALHELCA